MAPWPRAALVCERAVSGAFVLESGQQASLLLEAKPVCPPSTYSERLKLPFAKPHVSQNSYHLLDLPLQEPDLRCADEFNESANPDFSHVLWHHGKQN